MSEKGELYFSFGLSLSFPRSTLSHSLSKYHFERENNLNYFLYVMHVHPAGDLIWTDILYFTANGSFKLAQKINFQKKY